MLELRDDAIVRLNRAVAWPRWRGRRLPWPRWRRSDAPRPGRLRAYHAVRADLLRRTGRTEEARAPMRSVLALEPAPAERLWLERRMTELGGG